MLSILGTTTLISVMNSVLFSSHPHQHVLTFALIDLGHSNCGKRNLKVVLIGIALMTKDF